KRIKDEICQDCGKAFANPKALQTHCRTAHRGGWKAKFVCEYCCARFATEDFLKTHERRMHADVTIVKTEPASQPMPSNVHHQPEVPCTTSDTVEVSQSGANSRPA